MRIRDLPGWPPKKFQKDSTMDDCPHDEGALHIYSATFIPGSGGKKAQGHLIIQTEHSDTGTRCSGRIGVSGMSLGRRAAEVLSRRKGMTLEDAGNLQIPGN